MKKVYFLHGFMGTSETHFANQIAYFKDALTYVIAQIREKGEGTIVGLSLGASLAIHIARRAPELVKGIVLTGYAPDIPDELKDVMDKQYESFSTIEEKDAAIAEYFMSLHGDRWKQTLTYVIETT
ncbi:alpha/beta fold hydrolase, partial [Pradoshia sp.]